MITSAVGVVINYLSGTESPFVILLPKYRPPVRSRAYIVLTLQVVSRIPTERFNKIHEENILVKMVECHLNNITTYILRLRSYYNTLPLLCNPVIIFYSWIFNVPAGLNSLTTPPFFSVNDVIVFVNVRDELPLFSARRTC